MSNTNINLQSVVNLCATHADLIPLAGVGGYTNEPALSLCNDVLSDLLAAPHAWKFNRKEMGLLVTATNKQDYIFAGAVAFTLGATAQGWAIALASNSAITVTAGVVTVTTLENHRFAVGDTVYLNGVTMTTGTASKYNSTFTDNGSSSAWSNGWVITAVTSNTFSFAATSGQNNSDVGGAPGITDFGWCEDASMVQMTDTSSPQHVQPLTAYRELPVTSRVANPTKVSVIADNGDGTLKIRFVLVPGTVPWGAKLVYQKAAPVKVALTDNWAPFPDSYSAVYRQALLYRMWRYINSPRADAEYQKLQAAIGKAQGSDDSEQTSVQIIPEEPIMSEDWWGW